MVSTNPSRTDPLTGGQAEAPKASAAVQGRQSRRDFLKVGAAGLAGATLAARRTSASHNSPACDRRPRGISRTWSATAGGAASCCGAASCSASIPRVGDFEKADVLIDGKTIAQVAPNIAAGDAEVVDCSGTIVMPGFITTHHHQYETLQRSIIPDGLLAGAWPQESYGSVVQNIWTAGRIRSQTRGNPGNVIWDLGRVPLRPRGLLHRASSSPA